jgi:hypothetical protein
MSGGDASEDGADVGEGLAADEFTVRPDRLEQGGSFLVRGGLFNELQLAVVVAEGAESSPNATPPPATGRSAYEASGSSGVVAGRFMGDR